MALLDHGLTEWLRMTTTRLQQDRILDASIMNVLEKRIIELSFKHKLTHISSCLNCVNLIEEIYEQRKLDDPFVLDNGHASLAHYVVLEKRGFCDAEEMVKKHGVHSSRDIDHGIWVSNGSLGQAATVAVGMALADKDRMVWLVTSDGAAMEGCVYEAFRFGRYLDNLQLYIVWNGYGAYGEISKYDLPEFGADVYYVDQSRYPRFLQGLQGHYIVLNQEQYEELCQS